MDEHHIRPELVKKALRDAIRSVLGGRGSRVLELRLGRMLGRDPYDAFYENPKLFCEALRSFFGVGCRGLLRVIASSIIERHGIRGVTPENLINLFNDDSPRSRELLFRILCSGYGSREASKR